MRSAANPTLEAILAVSSAPCCSIYLGTHRTQPERRDDVTRYRALVRAVADSLSTTYDAPTVQRLTDPLNALLIDEEFWNARKDGIAVFTAPDFFEAIHLDRSVPDTSIVADRFHVKPLLRLLQTTDRYNVLAVTRNHIRVYEGDRDGLEVVDAGPLVPLTIEDALGSELSERSFARSNSGGTPRSIAHTTVSDEIEIDTERFFRVVDKAVTEHVSRKSGLPLILAGLPEQLSVFQKVRKNPNILLEGIPVHPDGISHKELVRRAWGIIEPYVHANSRERINTYVEARSQGRGLNDLVEIAFAATEGRVDTLLVEATRQVPGRINPATGDVRFDDIAQTDINDLLDDLSVLVLKKGGRVLVLPTEVMPEATGAAAVLRY